MTCLVVKVLGAISVCVPVFLGTNLYAAKPKTSPPTEDNRPLLGFVVLNKTTLGEFSKMLENQGCTLTYDNGVAQVDEGCIQLPGNPKIRAITSLKRDSKAVPWESWDSLKKMPVEWAELPIEALALYTRNYGAWKEYLGSLSKIWGNPTKSEGYDGSSGSFALWKKNNIAVELKRVSGFTWITYISPIRQKRLEEIKLSQEKIEQQNLNLL